MNYNFLVDSHCHLNMLEDSGVVLDEIIDELEDYNIKILNNICASIDEAEEVIKITEKYKNVYCSIGHHPEELSKKSINIDDLLKYKNYKKLIGIGESGLDYFAAVDINKNKQIDNFLIHIEVARQLNLPLIIHSRNADVDMKQIITEEIKKQSFSFVLHCFCSGIELAKTGLDCGGFISFSGILTFKNANDIQDIAKKIPTNKILVETDSPYLAPVPKRGKQNHPSYTKFTADFLADLLGLEHKEIYNITTTNFLNLFNKNNKIVV